LIFLFLTETWLDSVNCNSILIESSPPDYNFISINRENRRGGGIAKIFKKEFQCQQSFYGDYASFEYLSAVLKSCPKTLLLTVYRPPTLSVAVFLEDFCELLSEICVHFDSIVISGDFNIHVDNSDNTHARDFLALIDVFNLTQHIQSPTHSQGHTLDLVMTKGVTVSTSIVDLALSDHCCIFFEVCLLPYCQNNSIMIRKRAINDKTCVPFEQTLCESKSSLPNTADNLLEDFNLKMTNIMDDIAPLKLKKSTKQKAPWMNDPLVKLQKKECRRTERKWRKSKLNSDYLIHKGTLREYNSVICKARQSHFSNIINSKANNSRALFSTIEKLTNPSPHLAPELLSVEKCNEFASFFKSKVENIRHNISYTSHSISYFELPTQRDQLSTQSY